MENWIFYAAVPILAALITACATLVAAKKRKNGHQGSQGSQNQINARVIKSKGNITINQSIQKIMEHRVVEDEADETQTLIITDEAGEKKTVGIVAYFTLKMNKKDYLIYHDLPPKTENGNFVVYTSELVEVEDDCVNLVGVDDDVWPEIQKVMINIAKDEDPNCQAKVWTDNDGNTLIG